MSFDARRSALYILSMLDKGQKTLDSILDEISTDDTNAIKRDRALMQALVYGVLRWKGRLDFLIARFSKTSFDKIDPKVVNILRLALFQIIYLERIPVSAAVNTAVDMAKSSGAPWVVGYVNALLRKTARDYHHVSFPRIEENATSALAITKSFPEWIIDRWLRRYGLKNTAHLCDTINTIPPITVRANTLKTSPQELAQALAEEAGQIKKTACSPDGITFSRPRAPIHDLGAFKAGWFQVQDEAAQLVSLLLDPQPGEKILDACAGLGGKTGHIAQLMKNKGTIVALDLAEAKLLRLKADMNRLGITVVTTVCHNLEQRVQRQNGADFDRILLDAPCSGLGVMRRNPDIKWRKTKRHLLKCQKRQIRYLENVSLIVKPSGILVYTVCSPEPEENEEVIDQFLKKHPEFAIDKKCGRLPDKPAAMVGSDGFFRTYPGLIQMDGFFSVRLRRIR